MDPDACLLRAEGARDNDDREECREALRDLAVWRWRGGFAASNETERVSALRSWLERAP